MVQNKVQVVKTTTYKSHFDRISILVSLLCMAHCILLPVFFTKLPVWGFEILENSLLEGATILISFLAGGWAIWQEHRKFHNNRTIPVLFIIGLTIMTIAVFGADENIEMVLKGLGAVLIITAHVLNWNKCRACSVCKQ